MRPETLWGPGPRRTVAVSLHEQSQGGAGSREAVCPGLGAQAHGCVGSQTSRTPGRHREPMAGAPAPQLNPPGDRSRRRRCALNDQCQGHRPHQGSRA